MPEANERTYHHGRLRPALLAAAEHTLREQGIEQLSLRELARDVGVSHGAPRRHFRDRQELLDALAVTGFERLDAELRSALDQAGEAFAPRLGALVRAYIRFATQDAALLELMFSSKHRPGAERVAEAASTGLALMHAVIVQGQADGELAEGDPEKLGIVLFATMQGIATLINGDMVRDDLLEGLVDAAIEQFLRGAGPE